MSADDRREAFAVTAIRKAWPTLLGRELLATVRDQDAFGALAWHLDQLAENGEDPVAVLRAIPRRDLQWAVEEADDAAAFLASRVRDR